MAADTCGTCGGLIKWAGWGTALKPAYEPIIVARKPLGSTVAACVLEHGTGGLNIDGCRVEGAGGGTQCGNRDALGRCKGHGNAGRSTSGETFHGPESAPTGRWPANLIHDGSPEVLAGFPETAPSKASMRGVGLTGAEHKVLGKGDPDFDSMRGHADQGGSAARFFYCAKASKADRDEGLEGIEAHPQDPTREEGAPGGDNPRNRGAKPRANAHPTVKPTDLMRYLCRLVTPPGGVVLDPFCGSGSTGKAAILEGFRFMGCELQPEYVAIGKARCAAACAAAEAEERAHAVAGEQMGLGL